jgi:hypothetical protein
MAKQGERARRPSTGEAEPGAGPRRVACSQLDSAHTRSAFQLLQYGRLSRCRRLGGACLPSTSRVEGGQQMNAARIAAIVLILAGVLGLVYSSFTYTKDTHDAKLGPIELSVKDKQTVNIPVWAGVGAIVLGGVLLLAGGKKA